MNVQPLINYECCSTDLDRQPGAPGGVQPYHHFLHHLHRYGWIRGQAGCSGIHSRSCRIPHPYPSWVPGETRIFFLFIFLSTHQNHSHVINFFILKYHSSSQLISVGTLAHCVSYENKTYKSVCFQ